MENKEHPCVYLEILGVNIYELSYENDYFTFIRDEYVENELCGLKKGYYRHIGPKKAIWYENVVKMSNYVNDGMKKILRCVTKWMTT